MMVEQTGAAFHDMVAGWHDSDWPAVHRNVRRLQARIVKATKEGRWGKVKALHRLLTHSYSGKALAVRRVTENKGGATPGVDQVIGDAPQKKATARATLRQRGYHPQPLRRVYIPKRNGKTGKAAKRKFISYGMQMLFCVRPDVAGVEWSKAAPSLVSRAVSNPSLRHW